MSTLIVVSHDIVLSLHHNTNNDTMPFAADNASNIKGNMPSSSHLTPHRCRVCNGYCTCTEFVALPTLVSVIRIKRKRFVKNKRGSRFNKSFFGLSPTLS